MLSSSPTVGTQTQGTKMAQELGESREAWGWDVWKQAEKFANNMKHEVKPFYLVYHAKADPHASNRLGAGAFKQTMKAYYDRPPLMIGLLVWYVNNPLGEFRFIPELSSPPDVPIDPRLLSEKAEDALPSVMAQGEKLGVLLA